ncbi:MAG: 2-oxoacid:ferredoxin oxidoreductase subunit alpha [Ignisphaera sp.]|nr:2-oxoacid:acceptor oxidoreductase subunit alpha [Ignisphaera sp.]MDW8085613.1 2-oxoacid:ferredoxin oxidoreductase subunit alpha [Ignisphaera sp.]
MPREEVGVILGGPQGSGIETSMMVLTRALARHGFGVIADREYFSNITGRHSYIHMLISSKSIPRAVRYPVDIVASMDAETLFTHISDVGVGGYIVYDTSVAMKKLEEIPSIEDTTKSRIAEKLRGLGVDTTVSSILRFLERERGCRLVGLDFAALLRRLLARYRIEPRLLSRYVSGIIVSAVATLLNLDRRAIEYSLSLQFGGREELVEQNLELLKYVEDGMQSLRGAVALEKPRQSFRKILVATGNDAVAMGKIVGGLRYQSYYPITPAADESFTIERHEYSSVDGVDVGPVVVMQTEDEISAVCSAIGAALAGARSATATSGPGFDLMVEGLSWAGANEVPVVITYYQRGGPSTGQPTRGSQSDLFNALFAGHGEFARIVISSGDHEEAFYDAVEAFNLAERFQVPVIHLLDKFLANSIKTTPLPDVDSVRIVRGMVTGGGRGYKRFDLSSTVSPRAFLGAEDTIMWYTGDEHDEYGHIVEDPENRRAMYSKRIVKMDMILSEIPRERKLTVYGDEDPEYIVVGWGSVKGAALDAIEALSRKGFRGAYVNVRLLWPFPGREVLEILTRVPSNRVVAVEHSYGVLISDLAAMAAGVRIRRGVAKFTGRPITSTELEEALHKIITSGVERVVLSYGA